MEKSTHEEQLFQPLQTNNKQYKIAVTYLFVYNSIFNVTNSNNKFFLRNHLLRKIFSDQSSNRSLRSGNIDR